MANLIKITSLILFPFVIGIGMPESEKDIVPFDADFNPEHLDGPFTGGFGELTCHSCHFDYDLNMYGGSLTVDGLPDNYQPGNSYNLTVTVESSHLENGGFQMTARFEDGSQAGSFNWDGDHLMYTPKISEEVKYLQHTRQSTSPTEDREVSWNFVWTAPKSATGSIIFNIAANAGNNDDSSFGDWIYVDELISNPGK
jgi:hypothetical protein